MRFVKSFHLVCLALLVSLCAPCAGARAATNVLSLRQIAEQGDAAAQFNMGNKYREGRGVPRDDAQAAEWYRRAADQGHAKAQHNLGLMYAEGRGVTQDETQAAHWCRKAAEQDLAAAQFNLGVMYQNGRGVSRNGAEAVGWYRKAAEQGDENAREALRRLEQ